MKRILLTLSALLITTATLMAQDSPLWLRKNDISPDGSKIAFTYKGNIYVVSAEGGKAQQLTTNPAYDSDPIWTPDGKNIIFSSYREKSKDIYKVSSDGGVPVRLTTHTGNEQPLEVLNDGSILFSANIQQDAQYGDFPGNAQLYMIGAEGGRPQLVTSLPISNISVSENGGNTLIVYEDWKGYEDPMRKHHTSSVTRDIWTYSPNASDKGFKITGNGTFTKLSTFEGEDRNPVFKKGSDTYYYISEQDGTLNLYKSSLGTSSSPKQLTFHKGNPVRYVSVADNGTICYSYDGELYTIKEGKEPEKVRISIVTDQVESLVQEKTLSSGASALAVSPNGKEVAVVLRGDVYVTSVDHNTTKRITNTPQQERNVWFGKDGRTLYYSAERNGHWGVWETALTDKEDKYFTYAVKMEEKLVTGQGETCFQPQVSPDGKYLAYLKDRTAVAVMDLESKKERILLDKNVNYSYQDGDQNFAWSPDSHYILCNYQANGGWNNEDVALIDVESGEITDLTESGYTDSNFRWALKGKAMSWASDKNGYRSHGSWGAEDDIYIMFFDGQRYSEFNKDKEDQAIAEMLKDDKEKAKEEKKEKKDSIKAEKKSEKLVLDLENRKDRIVRLTRFSGRLGDHYLTQDGKKLYYITRLERTMDLCMLNLEDNSIKVVAKGVNGEIIPTEDDKYMYMLSGGGVSKISTASGSREVISFTGNFEYKPAEEREYMFDHIWKQVKEKFYDADIHGIDWAGYYDVYKKFLPHIDNNFDFQEMLSEMLGELNGSHTGARYQYRSGMNTGTLGVLFDNDYEGDGLKIQEVIKGGTLYITDPEIKAGDIITAIDGVEIKAGTDWASLLRMKGGKKIVVSIKKGGKKAVEMYVEPAFTDYTQMYKRWVEQRAEMVKKLSGGRIGYVHVEGMDSESFRQVYSDLLGKYRSCEAVIVDTRHNGGGWLHDDLATLLDGEGYIRFEPRGQYIGTEPYNKWTKPSCVLIGEDNYSDACGFPYVYKALGIGKLIGAPVPGTMTAVWWENQIDQNIVFGIPQVGAMAVKEGRYLENMQIEPDILVYNDPASVLRGEDRQLEAAVAEMMKTIEK
ncbi:MAG: PD40 domain-containing protein [Bacteroidales bacterium]|nr:PD40 domain-containing protein [Bacteroidales bacterium]